jgi:hypothetical protein
MTITATADTAATTPISTLRIRILWRSSSRRAVGLPVL